MLSGMSVVADQPSEPGTSLAGRERRQGHTSTETTTVDLRSDLGDQAVGLMKGVGGLRQRSQWVKELGLTVSVIGNARHRSERLGFGPDYMSDYRGNTVCPRVRRPV